LDSLAIPVSEDVLQALHEQVAKRARQRLAEERFGKRVATAEGSQPLDDLAQKLNDAIDREYKVSGWVGGCPRWVGCGRISTRSGRRVRLVS
jgi:hypothetical protein